MMLKIPLRWTPAGPALPLLQARALRAFADGYVAIVLPAYLLALGLDTWQVGVLATSTLLGSALATLAIGAWGHHARPGSLLSAAALLIWTLIITGVGFLIHVYSIGYMAGDRAFARFFAYLNFFVFAMLTVAFVGTLNPSSGDVSVFLPLEHARLAGVADGSARTVLFARYSLGGALFAAFGALAAALPGYLAVWLGWSNLAALRAMFVLYGLTGIAVWWRYQGLSAPGAPAYQRAAPLGPSRHTVIRLAALFSVDSLAGGLVVNALLVLWLFKRFDLPAATAGVFFFWSGLCTAASQLVAPVLARRIGLLNTMVFTHIPASICLIAAAFAPTVGVALALLLVRALLSQMDVPARSAFVMAVVTPPERAAAASFTAVPRSLASAAGPTIGGVLFSVGLLAAPLVACGILKIAYDIAIWRGFRAHVLAES